MRRSLGVTTASMHLWCLLARIGWRKMSAELHYTHGCSEHGAWTDAYQLSVCPRCGEEDLEEISDEEYEAILRAEEEALELIPEDDDDDPEFFERDGMEFCGACGILARPGEEEFDWCDHKTGAGCYHMQESVFADDVDEDYPDFGEGD